jgi:hypothetical protein
MAEVNQAVLERAARGSSSDTSAASPLSTEARPVAGPPRHEIVLDGGDKKTELLVDTSGSLAERLRVRLGMAEELQKDQKRLGTIDRLLLQKGAGVIEKFAGNEALTREELSVAWVVIHDELIQKTSATDTMVRKEISEGKPARLQALKNIPFLRRFSRDEEPGSTNTGVVSSEAPRLTSDYLEKLHFTEWSADEIETDLKALNNLRVSVEGQLGFETNKDDWTVPDFQRGGKSRLHNSVVDRMGLILAREHEGKTFAELHHEDPVIAAQVRHKAIQEGLMHFSDEFAKSVLTAEKPDVEVGKITRQIEEISKPADPKEEEAKTAERTEAEAKYRSAKSQYERLSASEDQAELSVTSAQDEIDEARANLEAVQESLKGEIRSLREDLSSLPPPPSGVDADAMRVYNEGVRAERDRIYREIDRRDQELRRMLLVIASAEQKKKRAERNRDVLKKGEETKGSIAWAKKAHEDAERGFREKEEALKELKEPAGDKADRRRALEMWRMVMERGSGGSLNYEKIIALGFAQGGDEARFTRDRLASIEEADGQLEGAELIREHIFGVIDEKWDIDPKDRELARSMLSDGQIANSIVRTFNLDQNALGLPGLDEQEKLKKVLPYLKNATQFQVGDMMRFMISRGLRGAEKGKPWMEVEESLLEARAETRLDALGLLREDMGEVKIGRNENLRPQFVWQGRVRELHGKIFGLPGPADMITGTDLNFRVSEVFDGGLVTAGVEVEVNEEFLKNLPPTEVPTMPLEIRDKFYKNGVLRTDIVEDIRKWKQGRNGLRRETEAVSKDVPDWVSVSDSQLSAATSVDMLKALSDNYSADIPRKLATQTANEVLDMEPAERLKVINGLPDFSLTFTQADTGDNIDVNIRVDNKGDFWINDPDLGEMELPAYFKRREEKFRGDRKALTTDERQALRKEFGTIQQYVGMRILENQQFRV